MTDLQRDRPASPSGVERRALRAYMAYRSVQPPSLISAASCLFLSASPPGQPPLPPLSSEFFGKCARLCAVMRGLFGMLVFAGFFGFFGPPSSPPKVGKERHKYPFSHARMKGAVRDCTSLYNAASKQNRCALDACGSLRGGRFWPLLAAFGKELELAPEEEG